MSIVQKIASKFFDKKRSKSIDSPFVMWQQAITQRCDYWGWIHIKICQTSLANCANWAVMESGCHLVKKFGTAPKQNLTESSFFEI